MAFRHEGDLKSEFVGQRRDRRDVARRHRWHRDPRSQRVDLLDVEEAKFNEGHGPTCRSVHGQVRISPEQDWGKTKGAGERRLLLVGHYVLDLQPIG